MYFGKDRLMYSGIDEKFTVFSFRTDNGECQKRIRPFPNTINNVTKYVGVSKKHWPTGIKKNQKKAVKDFVYCLNLKEFCNRAFPQKFVFAFA